MPRFQFTATTASGARFSGLLRAPSRSHCQQLLTFFGLRSPQLVALPFWKDVLLEWQQSWWGQGDPKESALFLRQLATMLLAGVPLQQALLALSKTWSFAGLLDEGVSAGNPLSQAMACFPDHFTPGVLQMVKVGECSGQLAETLERSATLLEKDLALRQQAQAALVYPAFVVLCFSVLALLVACFVMPRFSEVLQTSNQPLSGPVALVLALFGWLGQPPVILTLLLALLLVLSLLPLCSGSARFRRPVETLLISLPPIRNFLVRLALVRLTYSLTVLLQSGISLADGLLHSANGSDSPHIQAALLRCHARVLHGASLSSALACEPLFPSAYAQTLATAEESSSYVALLNNLRAMYEYELELTLKTLLSVLEPMILLVMGLVVGAFLLTMFLPMARLFENLGGA